jgi:penicillin-binding protein 1C
VKNLNKKLKIFLIAAGVILTPVLLSPLPRFKSPLSTVVEAADGSLLGARIADDGQWRFPAPEEVPEKFEKSLLAFEDQWFRYHPGINPISLLRAASANIKNRDIVSGGSTITMQVARIAGGNNPRTYGRKILEMISAMKLELFRSKKQILGMYTANAPFGGNIVGLEAASWRYTGKSSSSLTWAEAAALAILPNSPGLVFPGRNQEILKERRDRLLRKLYDKKYFDSITFVLSLDESVPGKPEKLPDGAPHLTDHFLKSMKGQRIRTTIDPLFQSRAVEIINNHQKDLSDNYIFNSACIIIEVETGNVLAYVGNSSTEDGKHGSDVDIIRSNRSTGSILKPFLYAGMQQSGDILPNTLVADIPTRFSGFSPKNFDLGYSGAVPAATALSQSLNIPAVKMLQKYNPEKFLALLKKAGFTSFTRTADYYGLSMILGGGETSLWELSGSYASMSRALNSYLAENKYYVEDYHPPVLIDKAASENEKTEDPDPPFSASAIWLTYEALLKVNRPESESGWQYFSSSSGLAWKTGTSFGFRDGWAAGTTPKYVFAVWAGNADGEGRPGLTGMTAAAPILFDLVNIPEGTGSWFRKPIEDLTKIRVCIESGYRAGRGCTETAETDACVNGLRSGICPYHQIVHLNNEGTFQVNSDCVSPDEMKNVPWFVLPPSMEYFYRRKHPEYKILPSVAPGCSSAKTIPVMEFIYPTQGIKIFIPRDQSGQATRIVAEVAHRSSSMKIFWHLDETWLGTTRSIHQLEIQASAGIHVLTVVDEDGNSIKCGFHVL